MPESFIFKGHTYTLTERKQLVIVYGPWQPDGRKLFTRRCRKHDNMPIMIDESGARMLERIKADAVEVRMLKKKSTRHGSHGALSVACVRSLRSQNFLRLLLLRQQHRQLACDQLARSVPQASRLQPRQTPSLLRPDPSAISR